MALRRQLGIEGIATNDDIAAALGAYGVQVEVSLALLNGPPELVIDRLLLLRPGLAPVWMRFLCPHGLGHVILHPGCSQLDVDWVTRNRQEHQADVFALAFLIGESEPDEPLSTAWQVAEWADIPEERVRQLRGLLRWRTRVR